MADSEVQSTMNILKNSKILVNVDEALQDIIVVTYTYESKIFQGVLLDTTNRTLPCGISTPLALGMAGLQPSVEACQEEDKQYSVSQRFTYFQEKPAIKSTEHFNSNQFLLKRPIRPAAKLRNARPTPVRLRPRQVLCSKCRGICNENSENVDVSQKRKNADAIIKAVSIPAELSSSKSPRPLFSENQQENQPKCLSPAKDIKLSPTLIPRISRLQTTEISNPLLGNANKVKIANNFWASPKRPEDTNGIAENEENDENDEMLYCLPVHNVMVHDTFDDNSCGQVDPLAEDDSVTSTTVAATPEERMVLRKKKSIGSMEDLWDESVFEECTKSVRTTPVIKISFGSQGEGTVMKIPSKMTNDFKAAKKALKRAKKEARRKLLGAGNGSPARSLSGMSPAGTGGSSPAYEELYRRRHKRNKVKHKKKHKEERKHRENGEHEKDDKGETAANKSCDVTISDSEMKELCLKQKLSISLKRLSANAYKQTDEFGSKSPTGSEMSDDHGEAVPDFPPPGTDVDSQESVDSCVTSDGRTLSVGDVIWGKILGFPWWPGKVSYITVYHPDGEQAKCHKAHVSWYGSSTMSVMPCNHLYPFLETFKVRFNKKKRGPYKEAIRQATSEANKDSAVLHSESIALLSPIIDVVT